MTEHHIDIVQAIPHYKGKRALDLTLIFVAHIVLLPIWLAIWILIPGAILITSGRPIFHRQERVGLGGRRFTALKFRTMRERMSREQWAAETGNRDPRLTLLGGILRRTALDEVPQIINIFKGDISFVGPRPLITEHHEADRETEPRFDMRLAVKPGLTGISQVYLPRDCGPTRRLAYDRYYIRRMSIFVDVRLILRSLFVTLVGRWGIGGRKAGSDDHD